MAETCASKFDYCRGECQHIAETKLTRALVSVELIPFNGFRARGRIEGKPHFLLLRCVAELAGDTGGRALGGFRSKKPVKSMCPARVSTSWP